MIIVPDNFEVFLQLPKNPVKCSDRSHHTQEGMPVDAMKLSVVHLRIFWTIWETIVIYSKI